MRTCRECKVDKTDSEFSFVDYRKDEPTQYRLECKVCQALTARLKRYNLTSYKYFTLLQKQNNGCAICKTKFDTMLSRAIHIDHDHKTGRVRGVLCFDCNTMLGKAKDSTTILQTAAAYLVDFSVRGEESSARLETAYPLELEL